MGGAYMRFLMADEVGMGKTIETGLVLKVLKLRGIVKRSLIIVPVCRGLHPFLNGNRDLY